MTPNLPIISLENTNLFTPNSCHFFEATTGEEINIHTHFSLEKVGNSLLVRFDCRDNPFLSYNRMVDTNDDLYNQEVFEIFISSGKETPTRYLEIEINPNNALWVGWIHNPSLGLGPQANELSMVEKELIPIRHSVDCGDSRWSGELEIPLQMITDNLKERHFRINFYRIVAKTQPKDKQWVCSEENAHFLCWSPTMSGTTPAFHRPSYFGHLILGND